MLGHGVPPVDSDMRESIYCKVEAFQKSDNSTDGSMGSNLRLDVCRIAVTRIGRLGP